MWFCHRHDTRAPVVCLPLADCLNGLLRTRGVAVVAGGGLSLSNKRVVLANLV